jgi:cytoskeletal protein RodZ
MTKMRWKSQIATTKTTGGEPGHRPRPTRADAQVGKLLTAARERRGWRLEAVAEALNIPAKQLNGLERGDFSVFPAEVYARGAFIKYAACLGVQTERQTEHAFMRVLSGAREFVPLQVHTPKPWLIGLITPRRVLAIGLLAVALLLGTYVAWQVNSFFRLPDLTLSEPVSGVVETTMTIVSGTVATDAEVAINGEEIPISADGSFSLELPLHHGVNLIEVSATNAAGRTRTISRDVLVPRN